MTDQTVEPPPTEPLVRWRVDRSVWSPIEVACPDGLWPHSDSTGEKIFENTHFETRGECLSHLKESVAIGVKWAGEEIARCKAALAAAEKKAGDAAEIFSRVLELES